MWTKSVDRKRCGLRFPIPEKRGEGITLYNNVGGRLIPGDIVVVKHSSTAGQEFRADLPTTLTTVYQQIAVAYEVIEKATIGKFITKGVHVDVFASGTATYKGDITLGAYLQVLNAALSASTTTMSIVAGVPPATTRAYLTDSAHDWDTDLFHWHSMRVVIGGMTNAVNNNSWTMYGAAPTGTTEPWDVADYSQMVAEVGTSALTLKGINPAVLDHATVRTAYSFGMAEEAYTPATVALIKCTLFGDRNLIAAT